MIRSATLRSALWSGLLLSATVVVTGCATSVASMAAARTKPQFNPANRAGADRLPETIRRVAVLPASGGTAALDAILVEALQRQNRFEVVVLDRADCLRRFRREEFDSSGALPNGFIETLRREWAVDAVLFVDVTTEHAYRPLVLGLRAKLASVEDVHLVWTFDNVFSAANPAVAGDARRHYLVGEGASELANRSASILQSPSKFATYVADATFSTLPPR